MKSLFLYSRKELQKQVYITGFFLKKVKYLTLRTILFTYTKTSDMGRTV